MGAAESVLSVANSFADGSNSGGQKFWSFLGFSSRIEWCAAFVSYCGINAGVANFPKLTRVTLFVEAFTGRNEYFDKSKFDTNPPVAGSLIIFDNCDHIGFAASVQGSTVVTKEGNYSDAVGSRTISNIAASGNGIQGWINPNYDALVGDGVLVDGGNAEEESTSVFNEDELGYVPDLDLYLRLGYGGESLSSNYQVTISDNDMAQIKKVGSLRGIMGMPPQFLPTTDLRVMFAESPDGSYNVNEALTTNYLGYDFTSSIIGKLPIVYLTPCEPVFLPNMASKKAIDEVLTETVRALAGASTEILGNLLQDYSGKIYSTKTAYPEYFKYVNPMCRNMAMFLKLNGEDSPYKDLKKTMDPYTYNWGRNYEDADEYAKILDNIADAEESNNNEGRQKYTTQSDVNWFQKLVHYRAAIPFYANLEPSVQEEMSNETTQSTLSSSINGLSEQAREIQYILGLTTSQVGLNFDKLKDTLGDSKEALDNFIKALPIGKNLFSTLTDSFNTVISGGKIIFPEIWSDSDFSRTYNITMKFISPSPDNYSIWKYILVPLAHIWGLVCPRQADKNGYSAPFLVRAFCKGLFNIDMGIITSCSITKGKENTWNKDGLPTVVEVSLSIKDLYKVMSITSMDSIKFDMMNNIAEMDFLANACGINYNVPDAARYAQMFIDLRVRDRIIDIPANILNQVTNKVTNSFEAIRSGLKNIRGI